VVFNATFNNISIIPWRVLLLSAIVLSVRLRFATSDYSRSIWDRRGRDRMVVRFTTTCTISAYHNHIYMTTQFPCLLQAPQIKVAGVIKKIEPKLPFL
jgi:hypothetical protein